jgi:hypothetical protein
LEIRKKEAQLDIQAGLHMFFINLFQCTHSTAKD